MKQTIKLGKIVVSDSRLQYNAEGQVVGREVFQPVVVEDIEIGFEISAEEMLTQMKNFKEFCSGTLELYKIVKGEIDSGDVAELVRGVMSLKDCDVVHGPTHDHLNAE